MATLLPPIHELSSRYDGAKRDTRSLLDRFWDSLIIPASEPTNIADSPTSITNSNYEQTRVRTLEIFTNRDSGLVFNVKSMRPLVEYRRKDSVYSEGSFVPFKRSVASHERQIRIDYNPRTQRNLGKPVLSRSLRPSERRPRRPKLSIPSHSDRSTTGISTPVTAVLGSASRFLSNMVKRGRERPSSPLATGYREDDRVRGMGSNVTINVVHDPVPCGPIDILGSAYIPETDDNWSAGIPHLSSTGIVEAETAREVDAISKLLWDRQVMRAQRSLQRIQEGGDVPV